MPRYIVGFDSLEAAIRSSQLTLDDKADPWATGRALPGAGGPPLPPESFVCRWVLEAIGVSRSACACRGLCWGGDDVDGAPGRGLSVGGDAAADAPDDVELGPLPAGGGDGAVEAPVLGPTSGPIPRYIVGFG